MVPTNSVSESSASDIVPELISGALFRNNEPFILVGISLGFLITFIIVQGQRAQVVVIG